MPGPDAISMSSDLSLGTPAAPPVNIPDSPNEPGPSITISGGAAFLTNG
jgi:hypothetical protein